MFITWWLKELRKFNWNKWACSRDLKIWSIIFHSVNLLIHTKTNYFDKLNKRKQNELNINKKDSRILNVPMKLGRIILSRHFMSISYTLYIFKCFFNINQDFSNTDSYWQSLKRNRFLIKTGWKYRIKLFFQKLHFREKQL